MSLKYVFDLDETLCITPENRDYTKSKPIKGRIKKVNRLYEQGHYIKIWTARGSGSGVDWLETTKKQLDEWGLKYHVVETFKPAYDVWVDDRAMNDKDFFEDVF